MTPVDENLRRYYLDAMGIQCWQELMPSQPDIAEPMVSDTDVADVEEATMAVADKAVAETSSSQNQHTPFEAIQQKILSCQQCAVHETYPNIIPGRGKEPADILILLLSPSLEDQAASTVCSGGESALLTRMLAAIGLGIDDVFITSLLKYAVPESHTIRPNEVAHGLEHLKAQLEYIRPDTILVMGDIAARCLLQKNIDLDNFRSSNQSPEYRYESIPLLFSYSPAELMADPSNKRKAWQDLQLLQALLLRQRQRKD